MLRFLAISFCFGDTTTFIVPNNDFRFTPYHDDKSVRMVLEEAHARYGLRHPPTDSEKEKCHTILRNLFVKRRDLLDKYRKAIGDRPYVISYNKVNPETVDMLREEGVFQAHYGELFKVNRACGYLVMAVLAQCCSSEKFPSLTDQDVHFQLSVASVADTLDTALSKETLDSQDEPTPLLLLRRLPCYQDGRQGSQMAF